MILPSDADYSRLELWGDGSDKQKIQLNEIRLLRCIYGVRLSDQLIPTRRKRNPESFFSPSRLLTGFSLQPFRCPNTCVSMPALGPTQFPINLLKPTGHVMHQQFNIQQLYALPTL